MILTTLKPFVLFIRSMVGRLLEIFPRNPSRFFNTFNRIKMMPSGIDICRYRPIFTSPFPFSSAKISLRMLFVVNWCFLWLRNTCQHPKYTIMSKLKSNVPSHNMAHDISDSHCGLRWQMFEMTKVFSSYLKEGQMTDYPVYIYMYI